MTSMPEVGRQAGHVLLDGIVAWDNDATSAQNAQAIELATHRLADIGAVPVELHGEADEPEVEVSITNLIMPAIVSMRWLVSRVSEATGQSVYEVVSDLRSFLDDDHT